MIAEESHRSYRAVVNQQFHAYLATGRVSNLPTVWCNVILGIVLIGGINTHIFSASIVASCTYIAGCFMGDAIDLKFDTKHKPDRPLVTGLISKQSVWFISILLFIAAFLTQFLIHHHVWNIAPLALVVVIYALFHKSYPWIGLPMIGLCRTFLVLFAMWVLYVPFAHPHTYSPSMQWRLFIPALSIGAYTICFASVARTESNDRPINAKKILMTVMFLLPFSSLALHKPTLTWGIFITLYLTWLSIAFVKINTNKGTFVSMCLAGFALLDACFLSLYSFSLAIIACGLFLLALLLQKFSPAT